MNVATRSCLMIESVSTRFGLMSNSPQRLYWAYFVLLSGALLLFHSYVATCAWTREKFRGVTNIIWRKSPRTRSPVEPKDSFLSCPKRQNLWSERIPNAGGLYCGYTCSSNSGEMVWVPLASKKRSSSKSCPSGHLADHLPLWVFSSFLGSLF